MVLQPHFVLHSIEQYFFIYCQAHSLQLAVMSAAKVASGIPISLATLKSLINFINR